MFTCWLVPKGICEASVSATGLEQGPRVRLVRMWLLELKNHLHMYIH